MAEATEAAQRLADEHGIDLASIEGTGSTGNITVEDVRARVSAGDDAAHHTGVEASTAAESAGSTEGGTGDANVEGTDENPVDASDVTDTAPPVSVFLRRGLVFSKYELEDGRVLHRDGGLLVHPDEWKSSLSKLSVGGVKIAEKR